MPDYQFDFEAAARLPTNIRFGTSTWTYPGWKGLIYFNDYKNEKEFKAESLKEYLKFPWFRSVGIDHSFYKPPSQRVLKSYAELAPQGFRWVSKVWEEITVPRYPAHPRYGKKAGLDNPHFLDAQLFTQHVLAPAADPEVKPHVGPYVFQFPTINTAHLSEQDYFRKLDSFLSALPRDFQYAVEIRNPDFLKRDYFDLLNNHGATHCFNHWHYMPPLIEQMKRAAEAGGLLAPFYVSRILTPRGVSYEAAVKMFQPYSEIKRANPEMRSDVVRLINRAIERAVDVYVIVNNRSEGNAPMTIDAIGRMVGGRK